MKTFKQLLEDVQPGYAPKEISYSGYTTKNLHHVPDAAKAFQATITRVQKGMLKDNGEVLKALKDTDMYMKLNDMHLEQEKDLDPTELTQWLVSHEDAKRALSRIGEFEHHYDYWNSHNSELQYLKANQNMPQEAESVQIDEGTQDKTPEHYMALAKKHVADGQNGTRANMVYASMMAGRARRAAEILKKSGSQEDAMKHYQGTKNEEIEDVAEGFADDFLSMAKNRNPNARIVTAVQKRKEAEETMKNREASGTKPAHASPTSNPRPLGGYDPKSNRSYSEEVELDEKTLTPAELKKREEIAKAMERKNPNMDKSRKMAIATAVAKRVAEQYDDAE